MGALVDKVRAFGERYGWGVVVASSTYVNGIVMLSAFLATFLVILFFSLFNISPGPPAQTGNPISWVLYLLVYTCYGWMMWSYLVPFFLIPLGAAWSLADLLYARSNGQQERYIGAISGLALTLLPIFAYFYYGEAARQMLGNLGISGCGFDQCNCN